MPMRAVSASCPDMANSSPIFRSLPVALPMTVHGPGHRSWHRGFVPCRHIASSVQTTLRRSASCWGATNDGVHEERTRVDTAFLHRGRRRVLPGGGAGAVGTEDTVGELRKPRRVAGGSLARAAGALRRARNVLHRRVCGRTPPVDDSRDRLGWA